MSEFDRALSDIRLLTRRLRQEISGELFDVEEELRALMLQEESERVAEFVTAWAELDVLRQGSGA